MAIPQKIKDLATKVRNEIYGKDVREAIARSIEESGLTASEAREITEQLLDESYDQGLLETEIESRMEALYDSKGQKLDNLYDEKEVDLENLKQDYADKADDLETTYAPRLTTAEQNIEDNHEEVTSQLAETATKSEVNKKVDRIYFDNEVSGKASRNEVRLKKHKIGLNDANEDLLAAIEGGEGAEFSILSEPRERSVSLNKMTEDVSGLNNYTIIPTYDDERLIKITEKNGRVEKKITLLDYDENDNLIKAKEILQDGIITSVFSYSSEDVDSISKQSQMFFVQEGIEEYPKYETYPQNVDFIYYNLPKNAMKGTDDIDYVARIYMPDGTELHEIPKSQRESVDGIGGFYWSDRSFSIVFEKGKYSDRAEAAEAHEDIIIKYIEDDE